MNITISMYNLIEYSDNYSDTSGSLWQFQGDEIENNATVSVAYSSSFEYKSKFVNNIDNIIKLKGVKIIVVPLKYLSNFWRSTEMPLINCKVELSLTWIENCILATSVNVANDAIANASKAAFRIIDGKLYVPAVTLLPEDNGKLSKPLST